jgi:hypothetical protein
LHKSAQTKAANNTTHNLSSSSALQQATLSPSSSTSTFPPVLPTRIPEEHTLRDQTSPFPLWNRETFPAVKPNKRQDVVLLERWFDEMLSDISHLQHTDPQAFLRVSNEIYSTAVHELIRQISVDCSDRGRFLSRLWVRFMELFTHLADQAKSNKDEYVRNTHVMKEDLSALREMYDRDVYNLKEAVVSTATELQDTHRLLLLREMELKNLRGEMAIMNERLEVMTNSIPHSRSLSARIAMTQQELEEISKRKRLRSQEHPESSGAPPDTLDSAPGTSRTPSEIPMDQPNEDEDD